MRDSARTTATGFRADRAEIVRTHETTHDARENKQFIQQNQRRARARFFTQNSMCEGGFIPSHTVVRVLPLLGARTTHDPALEGEPHTAGLPTRRTP